MTRKNRRKTAFFPKGALVITSVLLLLFFLIYMLFTYHFKTHFFWRTEINNLSVSGMTLDEATDRLAKEAESYLLTIYDRDGNKYHISASDIDYTYIPGSEEAALLEQQHALAWPKALFSPDSFSVKANVTYDETMLASAVSSLSCFDAANITEPEDARLEKNEDGFTIVSEISGTHLIEQQVLAAVSSAVSAGETELTLSDGDYIAPQLVATDSVLTDALSTINQYLATTVTYDIADADEILDKEKIINWIVVGDDYSVSLDTTKLASYVQSLASKYNTYADVRNFLTSKGDIIAIGGGDYGWIIDKEGEAAQLASDLATGTAITREPVYQQRALYRETDDIGKSYVEIDYTNQHLWYYKDGTLIAESDIVSGKISNGNGSPDGVYKIVYKQSPAVLKGEDYESNVTYFMPFAYNVGIHDASWRNAFGGQIYKNSGSHGCINVPLSCATAIYEAIDIGTPVVAYYREPVSLTSKSAKISNAYSYVDPEADTVTP